MTDKQRFDGHVNKGAIPDSCWLWGGARDADGYGVFKMHGRTVRAHRYAYEFTFGGVPPVILHLCDTPACVNPSHLAPGTQADNMADRDAKGRQAKGEANAASLLSDSDRAAIIDSWASDYVLAKKYGISARTVREIRQRGRAWQAS